MFSFPRLSPYIVLFLLLPLVLLVLPDSWQRLYHIATFRMTDEHHHHHHHHHHGDDAEFTEKNRNHWDKMATSYDTEQWQKDMLNAVHGFLLSNINWIGVDFIDPSSTFENNSNPERPIRVLDYACGPGTITNFLYSHANEFVGVDLAQGMVDEYNKRFSHTLPGEVAQTNAKAVRGNLIDPASANSVPEAQPGTFDLVVVGFGFHHFKNLAVATERLTAYLRPGGVFMIADFVTHASESTENVNMVKHMIAHFGFGEQEVVELFAKAGLIDVKVKVMKEEVFIRGTDARTVFLARGVKH